MESTICGSYAAIQNNVLCDPMFESKYPYPGQGKKPYVWRKYLVMLENLSDDELKIAILKNIEKDLMQILETRKQLHLLIS